MPKIIAFSTLKGGAGKSTLLMLTAAAVKNRTSHRLLVIDSDPQLSVKQIHQQENHPQAYDVFAFNWLQQNPQDYFAKVLTLAERKYDLVFMDLPPGRITDDPIMYSLLAADTVIVPIVASQLDVNATTNFLTLLPELMADRQHKPPLEVFGVINKQDQTVEYKHLTKLAGQASLQLFYTPLSNRVRYKRGVSTWRDLVDPTDPTDEFNRYFDEFRAKCFI
ncbi:MAG: ParA family protein [Bernardetiaceae bacterium]|jgi:chromosome partitioning protein|nr:ParA family protein [Bernardetiaceae bacterium]